MKLRLTFYGTMLHRIRVKHETFTIQILVKILAASGGETAVPILS